MANWREKFKLCEGVGTCNDCDVYKPLLFKSQHQYLNLCHKCWLAHFVCLDCGINTREIDEYYVVQDTIWRTVHPAYDGMLCIGCVESRLGRQLEPKDFKDVPVNHDDTDWPKSDRLVSRLFNGHRSISFL